jgi:RNA polymerase sigma-70 factor (ECF subfamily)
MTVADDQLNFERNRPAGGLLHEDWTLTVAFAHMTRQETFEQIVLEQDVMIKRIASSYEAQTHLVEDLVQDIYFAIWRALPSFRGDSSFRTFVARIATNRGATHVARALRFPPYLGLDEDIPAPQDGPEGRAIELDRGARLTSAVRSLPLAYRQTASLTLEGLTPKEIADVLGITTNAVAIRMSRAKALLQAIIGESP